MRNYLLFSLLLITHFISTEVFAIEYKGRVVRVISGDTILLFNDNKQTKIRLAGIMAPKNTQPFFEQSKKSLEDLVFNKDVTVIHEKTVGGKIFGKIYIGEPQLDIRCVMAPCYEQNHMNIEQIRLGMVWVDPNYQDDSDLTKLQEEAMLEKRGLWRDSRPVPPWKWAIKKQPTPK